MFSTWRLAAVSKKIIQPRDRAYMIDVNLLRCLWARMFFRKIVIKLFFSQKKKTYEKMISKIPWKLVTISVSPRSIPNKMRKKMDSKMLRF